MSSKLSPLDLLKSELTDGDNETVLRCIQRLALISAALGPEQTRNQLLPLLREFGEQDNDEAHALIAEQLGSFAELVGGGEHVPSLLPLLEYLGSLEETVVRRCASRAVAKLVHQMPVSVVAQTVVPLARRMATADWFTSRVSACGVIPDVLKAVSARAGGAQGGGEEKNNGGESKSADNNNNDDGGDYSACVAELSKLFAKLAADDTPMVRRAAYAAMPNYITATSPLVVAEEGLDLVHSVVEDSIDSMRVYAVEACCAAASRLDCSSEERNATIVPIVEALHDDDSWRVRQELARYMARLCEALGEPAATGRLLPLFATLLEDKEPQVRIASAVAIRGVMLATKKGLVGDTGAGASAEGGNGSGDGAADKKSGGADSGPPGGPAVAAAGAASGGVAGEAASATLEQIVKAVNKLARDDSEKVRIAVSSSLALLSAPLGAARSQKLLVPTLQLLARDELSEVRNNVIESLDVLSLTLEPRALREAILPTLLELAQDAKWRVRVGVISKMGLVAKKLGREAFEGKMRSILVDGMSDHVFCIRERSCGQVRELLDLFGTAWAAEQLIPPALGIYDTSTNYLHRTTSLLVIQNVAPALEPAEAERLLLPVALKACEDEVANVRFAAAKTLAVLVTRLTKETLAKRVHPVLERMAADADADVRHYAGVAAKAAGK